MDNRLTPKKIDRLIKLANGSAATITFANTDFIGNLIPRQR